MSGSPPCRAWDNYDAYIFDIDDTLLHCDDAVHYFAFCSALQQVAGRSIDLAGVRVHGSTDLAILRDAFLAAGVDEPLWRPHLAACCNTMRHYVANHSADLKITVLPGVREAMARLAARGATLGLGTGNLHAIARAKLNACALWPRFRFGAFSDDCEQRQQMMGHAREQARALAGVDAAICVVGDTPYDIQAAHAHGLDIIAVATGSYPLEALRRFEPARCVGSLAHLLA